MGWRCVWHSSGPSGAFNVGPIELLIRLVRYLFRKTNSAKKGGEVCERFSSGGAWRLVIQALRLRPPTLGLRKQRLNTPFFTPAPPPPFITQHASRIISHHYKNGEIRN
jgi:hypothetical protein